MINNPSIAVADKPFDASETETLRDVQLPKLLSGEIEAKGVA